MTNLTAPVSSTTTPHHSKETDKSNRIFAPLSTPLPRRVQTFMIFWHSTSIAVFASLFLFLVAFFPFTWAIVIPYTVYFIFDKSFENGNVVQRYSLAFRKLGVWKSFCSYFPIVIHKTADIPPSFDEKIVYNDYYIKISIPFSSSKKQLKLWRRKPYKTLIPNPENKYIFCYHPHGVVAMGAMGAVGTDGASWSKIFPNVQTSLLTLETQSFIPFYRDYLLALGISSVAKKNIQSILKQNHNVCIVLGGARESLLAKPHSRKLVLQNRKGFVKIALQTAPYGAKLVPMFAFGENEVYEILEPPKNSALRKFQHLLKKHIGFTIPFFHARGIFNYDFGLLPYRRKIDVVVGEPINVPYVEGQPSTELIEEYHEKYVNALVKLYNDHKLKFGYKGELEIQ